MYAPQWGLGQSRSGSNLMHFRLKIYLTSGGTNFTNFPENQLTKVYSVQAVLALEVAALKIHVSVWTPSMTVHPHFVHNTHWA